MQIIKEVAEKFIIWTKLKITIHLSQKKFYPRERQIWWVSLGQNIGTEINGKNERFERPALVLKRYHDDACLIAPISSKVKIGSYYQSFTNHHRENNVINFSQIRSVNVKRFIRMIGKISHEDFEKSKIIFKNLI